MDAPLRMVPAKKAEGARVAEGTAQFEDFFHAEHARLFRALCMVTGSRDQADEIAQEAFLKVLERWDRVAAMEDPRGYLYRTAMNAFRSGRRSAVRAMKRTITFSHPDDAFAAVEDRDIVIRALRELIPQQRAAVVLTALLGYSSEEAGRMLGMKAATVRTLTTRARAVMRQAVGEIR